MKRFFVFVASTIFLASCAAPFSSDEEEAREELLSIAPIGSDARQAKTKLERKGFDCEWNEDQEFSGLQDKNDYLYCDKTALVGLLVVRRWQLALVHEEYLIKEAKFGIDLTGP